LTGEDLGFNSEGDEDGDATPIPAGAKNYITPAGLARLQDERRQLWRVDRPEVARTAITFMGSGACARSTGASAS
jgi:transcription elongation factor GreB